MLKLKNELAWITLSFIIGFGLCYIIFPQLILHPTNFNTLRDDPLLSFTAWDFYRQSPWQWPITFANNIMYPTGTNIVAADCIPLVSILFKLFSSVLPDHFIWIGFVGILNGSLMFYSGSLFFRILGCDRFMSFIGGLFTILSAAFLWRLAIHISLTSQWLIIFELILILKPKVNPRQDILYQWLLIFVAISLSPYISAMIIPLSCSLCWKLYIRKSYTFAKVILIFITNVLFALLFAWFLGWFSIQSSVSQFGYGSYSSNLLTLINPEYGSILLPTLPQGKFEYEGFAYLGIGIIIPLAGMLILAFLQKFALFSSFNKERLVLALVLALFFIFALSNVIQFGPFSIEVFKVQDGTKLANLLQIYRCTGRFMWPVFYTIQFFTLIKLYSLLQFHKKLRVIALILLVILQMWDNSYLINSIKNQWLYFNNIGPILSKFTNPIWLNLDKFNIKHLFILDNINTDELQLQFAVIALENHLTINKAHIARINTINQEYNAEQFYNLLHGKLLPDTLYVGVENKGFYPGKYCLAVDGYVICALNPELISHGSPTRYY